jgi:hypothetical protein
MAAFYDDYNPTISRHDKDNVTTGIDSLRVVGGTIPHRALGLVMVWNSQRQEELLANVELAEKNDPQAVAHKEMCL